MARHLMAVCVVCLLCADHLPCHQHLADDGAPPLGSAAARLTDGLSVAAQRYTDTLHLPNPEQRAFLADDYGEQRPAGRWRQRRSVRAKRHSHDHAHNDADESPPPSRSFVRQLFERFGSPDDTQTMNVLGFERMLSQLGLYELVHAQATDPDGASKCMSSLDLAARVSSVRPPADHGHRSLENGTRAVANATIGQAQALADAKQQLRISAGDFEQLCPLLVYQLTANTSRAKAGCIDEHEIASAFSGHRHKSDHDGREDGEFMQESRTLVWVYAMGSILIASLCGLLAVAVIPCMESNYYHYLLQFFVALGVGTLAGDALLHLIPHAMMTRAAHTDEHIDMTLKGLTAAAGVAFSFLMERGLTMVAEWRKRIEKKEKPCSRVRVMRDPDNVSLSHQHQQHSHHHQQHSHGHPQKAGEKLCKAKYSSYPYCYDEIDMETRAGDDTHHHHHQQQPTTSGASPNLSAGKHGHSHHHNNHSHKHSHGTSKVQYKSGALHDHDDYADTAQSLLPNSTGVSVLAAAGDSPAPPAIISALHKNGGGGGDCGDADATTACLERAEHNKAKAAGNGDSLPKENYTIILREHEAKHHGHSHTHGHVHSPPSSMSAVAWMVIMGDGMHNFTDGMAIGAAFSYNIAGGFSTALAVFCHELPHELGDFAILLKAGMSPRQALFYNLLSSVLSLIGTVIGIWIGATPQASAWIFAAAAGMFLYIALVDMMPELTSSHKEESFAYTQLVLQMIGMLLGIGIMLLIALYEHDLKLIFSASGLSGTSARPH